MLFSRSKASSSARHSSSRCLLSGRLGTGCAGSSASATALKVASLAAIPDASCASAAASLLVLRGALNVASSSAAWRASAVAPSVAASPLRVCISRATAARSPCWSAICAASARAAQSLPKRRARLANKAQLPLRRASAAAKSKPSGWGGNCAAGGAAAATGTAAGARGAGRQWRSTRAVSSRALMGLPIWSDIPAARQASRSAGRALAVIAMIGVAICISWRSTRVAV